MGDTGASGFYRLKHDPGGKRSSVLLALKLAAVRPGAGADPAAAAGQPSLRFHFVRPCTGRLPRAVDQSELLHKYVLAPVFNCECVRVSGLSSGANAIQLFSLSNLDGGACIRLCVCGSIP